MPGMANPAPFHPLDSDDALERALEQSDQEPVVLFKHSNTCSLSARANREMQALTEDDDPPIYRLIVQESRALSNRIAADFDIRHESPQVIVLNEQTPVFDASHLSVSATAIRNALPSRPA